MRKISMVLSVVLLVSFNCISYAKDITVTFGWDADTSTDNSTLWEVLNIYERNNGEEYNYTTPKDTVIQSYDANGNSIPITKQITTTAPDNTITDKYWVIRAQSGEMESYDSNEVTLRIDLTPLVIPVYTAIYDSNSKTIEFSWTIDDDRAISWRIFSRIAGSVDWVQLAEVDSSGAISIPIDTLFPTGEKTTQEFTMVVYGEYDMFSPNAVVTSITLNRIPPSGVINFKVILVE